MDTSMIQVQNLSVELGNQPILREVTFSVQRGEILGILGPNGAGKTTLIRALSGILPPAAGQVQVLGRAVHRLTESQRARLIAVVPQARHLPPAFTGREVVQLGRTPYLNWLGNLSAHDHACVQRALERASALELADRLVGELSGGEQQRLLLARALAQETPVLLLDEPTTHLDLQHQSSLLNLVRSLADERQLAVLMALHDLNLAGLYADRVALLVDGHLQACGAPHQVLTEQTLAAVYHIPVHVMTHPEYGSPLVLPDGREGVKA